MQKVTKSDFQAKLYFGQFLPKKGQKIAQNQPFFSTSKFPLYVWLNFVPKCASYGYNLDCTIRFPGKTQFVAFFGQNRSRPIRSLDLEIAISREPLGRFFCFFAACQDSWSGNEQKQIRAKQFFIGQNGPFSLFRPKNAFLVIFFCSFFLKLVYKL